MAAGSIESFPVAPGQAFTPSQMGPLLDQYAGVSHKQAVGDGTAAAFIAPSWVPQLERRRLAAYTVLQAYYSNVARHFLPSLVDTESRREHREYGDAALLVHQALAALLGDEQTVVVDPLPDADDLPGAPSDDQAEEDAEDAALTARQDWLDTWAGRERLFLKLTTAETNAVKIGDGVYTLGWNATRRTVEIRQYDPGFYFPVLSGDEDIDEFPAKVHLAWELLHADMSRSVRRITYELVDLTADDIGVTQVGIRADGTPIWGRAYPWAADDDDLPTRTCKLTDATWPLGEGPRSLDDLALDNATFAVNGEGVEVRDLDLLIDFLPVVHIPNTPEGPAHFGRSIITAVAQVLDDIQATDSDLQVGSATVAGARLKAKGGMASQADVPVGTVYNVPTDGDVSMLDTSTSLDAQLKYADRLEQKLTTNSRLAPALLGKQRGSVPSGIALQLSFGPTQSLVRELRQIRDEKYPLLLKFVQRLAIVGGVLDAPVYPARVAFGSFLPADKQQAVDQATTLLGARAISTITAVGLLVEAGFPIDDAQAEVERIHAENFTQADALLAATGDTAAVRDYLGLPPGPRPSLTPPIPPLPPAEGGEPGSSQ